MKAGCAGGSSSVVMMGSVEDGLLRKEKCLVRAVFLYMERGQRRRDKSTSDGGGGLVI